MMQPPEHDKGRPGERAASKLSNGNVASLVDAIDHMTHRLIQEVVADATRAQWFNRAQAFEAARHRPGIDYAGRSSIEDLREQWIRLTEIAKACRVRADMAPLDLATDVANVLGEVA